MHHCLIKIKSAIVSKLACSRRSSYPGRRSVVANMHLGRVGNGMQGTNFLWIGDSPDLASRAGNCSLLQSVNNSYQSNHAGLAGGAIYSTDKQSLWLNCTADAPLQANASFCEVTEWSNNSVGVKGYGSGIAYLPASIQLQLSSTDSYVSNGDNRLSVAVHVKDQVGTIVTTGEAIAQEHTLRHAPRSGVLSAYWHAFECGHAQVWCALLTHHSIIMSWHFRHAQRLAH